MRVVMKSLALALLIAATILRADSALADTYPSRLIRIIVPTAPGGSTDLLGRMVANHISTKTGVQVVVENRAGAGGNIGMDAVAKAAPDGYTLGFANTGLTINPYLYKSMPFDARKDLAPVGPVGDAPQLLVINAELPAKTLQEFIALAKAAPGRFNYGSAGLGSTVHLAGDQFSRSAGLDMTHVPYRGSAPAVTDLVRGSLQMISISLGPVAGFVASDKLRVLAAASKKRVRFLPDVPTSAEAGLPGYEMTTWFGLFAPAGTPQDIVDRLNGYLAEMLVEPATQKRLADNSIEALQMSAGEFARFLQEDSAKWERVVRDAGLQAQ
jgi:tripartite-type tricarboxylate transporter receptor subunit TctC